MEKLIMKKNGFTLLFAILVISVALSISLGATTLVVSQLGISRDTRNSLEAFYAASAGEECALYWDVQYKFDLNPPGVSAFDPANPATTQIECNNLNRNVGGPPAAASSGTSVFEFDLNNKCVQVTVEKTVSHTTITSRGRNTPCPFSSVPPGTFERIVQTDYGL